MLSELVAEYENIATELVVAIDADDLNKIRVLDEAISIAWNGIIEFETTCPKDTYLLADFLIQFILKCEGRQSSEAKKAAAKLLGLFSYSTQLDTFQSG